MSYKDKDKKVRLRENRKIDLTAHLCFRNVIEKLLIFESKSTIFFTTVTTTNRYETTNGKINRTSRVHPLAVVTDGLQSFEFYQTRSENKYKLAPRSADTSNGK